MFQRWATDTYNGYRRGTVQRWATDTYMAIEEVCSIGGCNEETCGWIVGVASVVDDFVKLHRLPDAQTMMISGHECR